VEPLNGKPVGIEYALKMVPEEGEEPEIGFDLPDGRHFRYPNK